MAEQLVNGSVPHLAREDLASVRASNIEVLLASHWQEIAHYKDIPLDVSWSDYEKVEQVGMLRIYTARVGRELVAYACYKVARNSHYQSSLQAIQDVLFVEPAHRRSGIGGQLVAFADCMLRTEGVQVTYQHSKVSGIGRLLDELLLSQGYELIERIWAKRLDQER
jgi:GNAT superfamily N-acetyltransferase